MAEKQRLLNGGIEPVGSHPDDLVFVSDGTVRRLEDALADCKGGLHGDEDTRDEADAEIVKDIVDALCKGADEYTEHEDYGNGYAYIACEVSHDWPKRIEAWICEGGADYYGRSKWDGGIGKALAAIIAENADEFDIEAEHSRNEYEAYDGEGCCLYSLDIGECEEQVDITCFDELIELDGSGGLERALEDYNGDAYLCVNDHYDREKKRRVRDGYVRHSTFSFVTSPGGQWHYIVSKERMNELLCAAIISYCEDVDGA
jgi:hypothetical protein